MGLHFVQAEGLTARGRHKLLAPPFKKNPSFRMGLHFVQAEGLEPTHLAALDPKSSVSTNSTTPALYLACLPPDNYRDHHACIVPCVSTPSR